MKKLLILLLLSFGLIGTSYAGEVDTNIMKLKAIKSCESCNLIGVNLSGTDLGGADLRGADLMGVNLSGANLSGANLSGANLSGANLSGIDFTGATLCNTKTPWGIDDSGC